MTLENEVHDEHEADLADSQRHRLLGNQTGCYVSVDAGGLRDGLGGHAADAPEGGAAQGGAGHSGHKSQQRVEVGLFGQGERDGSHYDHGHLSAAAGSAHDDSTQENAPGEQRGMVAEQVDDAVAQRLHSAVHDGKTVEIRHRQNIHHDLDREQRCYGGSRLAHQYAADDVCKDEGQNADVDLFDAAHHDGDDQR